MKANWHYIRSELLNQEIAYDSNSGWIFCKDGVRYSPLEIRRLAARQGAEMPLAVHNLKKLFGGEIIGAPIEEKKREKK